MSAELLGVCREFEFRGKHHFVAPVDLAIEGQFVNWVASEAALALSRLRPSVPADFYAEQMRIYNAKVSGKQFVWGRGDVSSAAVSPDGEKHLLWLKLKRGEAKGGDPVERITIDEIAKDAAKWQELLMILYEQDYPDFFDELQREKAEKKNSQQDKTP